tara:strand:- start:43226 stop:43786 length:561 start_codon:yes stop_codon:yes gene_type:complete
MSLANITNEITRRLKGTMPVELEGWKIHDAPQTNITATAGTDDMGLKGATFGTDALTLQSSDGKVTTLNQYARKTIVVPPKYKPGTPLTLRVRGGMVTTVSDTSAVVDASVYIGDGDGGISADIVTTAATTINSLTKANVDFSLTSTALVVGSVLDVRLLLTIVDGATGTAVLGEISNVALVFNND